MGGLKVAIIGAGDLGALLAARVPGSCRKVIIDRDRAQAVSLADEVGGLASDQVSAVRGSRVILLAVSDPALAQLIADMTPHLDDGALVVNMAPTVMTAELAAIAPRHRFAAAKLVGDPQEMSLGSPGAVLLDHVNAEEEVLLESLLQGLGPVTRDPESKAQAIRTVVTEVMAQAESDLRQRLLEVGADRAQIHAAITTAGPGILRAMSEEHQHPPL